MASNETPSANQQGTVEENIAEAGRELEDVAICGAGGAGLPPPIAVRPEEIPSIEVCYWPSRPQEEPSDVQPDPDLENVPICGADGAGLPPPIEVCYWPRPEEGPSDVQPDPDLENVPICGADGAGLPPPIEVCYWPRPEEEPSDVQPNPDLENFPICGADGAGLPPPIVAIAEEIPSIEGGDVSVCPACFEEGPPEVQPVPDLEDVPICGADGAGLPPPIAAIPEEITFIKEQVNDE